MTPTHIVAFDRSALFELTMTPLFLGLGEDELRYLLGEARIEIYADGLALFSAGDLADRFFVMLDGHIEIFVVEGRRRSVVEIVQRPAVLGEAALFADGRHPHSARSVGHAKVLAVPAPPFLAVLDQRFDLALRMLGSQSIRLRRLVEQISRLKLKTTAQRLAGFLLGLSGETAGSVSVRFPYDKRLAAETLGMTAESLSRALARLASLGVESRPDNVVFLADLRALTEFVMEEGAD
ncbi:MAG TPA: Crp/Fnr family transcriptional regulator [Rhodospirillaceae bacterium]|nr:Crp/Fnr family transcriptional regulator [Rhodospirillaceae bacterium]